MIAFSQLSGLVRFAAEAAGLDILLSFVPGMCFSAPVFASLLVDMVETIPQIKLGVYLQRDFV